MNPWRPTLLAAAALVFFVTACSQPEDLNTVPLTPQFGTVASDSAAGLARYNSSIYVVGGTSGSLHIKNKGGKDAFIRKVDTRGKLIWGRQFGTSADDRATAVATDAKGNAYVLGVTSGVLARSLRGPSDFFLRKYTVTGGVAWTLQFGLDTEDTPGGLVVSGKYVYVVGNHQDIGSVLYKFNLSNGDTWFKTQFAGDSPYRYATGIASDSSGNLYVAGSTEVPCGFEDYDDCSDVLLVKLNPLGRRLWSKQLYFSEGDRIAQTNTVESFASYANDIYLITDAFDVPNDESTTRLIKLNTAGAVTQEQQIASAYSYDLQLDRAFTLSVDGTGVYVGTNTYYYRQDDQSVIYSHAKYGADGQPVWRKGADGNEPDPEPRIYGSLDAIFADGGGLYIAGDINSSTNGGNSDAFLKRVNHTTGEIIWSR